MNEDLHQSTHYIKYESKGSNICLFSGLYQEETVLQLDQGQFKDSPIDDVIGNIPGNRRFIRAT